MRNDKGKLDKGASRWFSVELTKDKAPWAYERDGQPFRVIAALEAIASLVSFGIGRSLAAVLDQHSCCAPAILGA